MSHTRKNRTNTPPHKKNFPYKRVPKHILARLMPNTATRARCFAAGKPKVCYMWQDAEAKRYEHREQGGIPLRVYPCGAHFHLTHVDVVE